MRPNTIDNSRGDSTEGFGTANSKRWRRFWLLAAVVALCVLLAIYLVVVSVTSTATEDPTSKTETPAGAQAPENPKADDDSRGVVTSSERDARKKPERVRTAPIPPPAESCNDLRVLVDHTHSLPGGYVPPDLVPLVSYGVSTMDASTVLRRKAARHLERLMSAAAADGEELTIASAYRSYAEQQQTFAQFTGVYGDETDTVSAPPGQSQHQLGTAVDFTNSAAEYRLWWPFGDTTASDWLLENAPDYGFVLAYPDGKESETGYQWEPWHYRYIGVKNATYLKKEDITLQKFLVREGVLPRC